MKIFSLLVLTLLFFGCSDDKKKEVHWDRDMCDRCKMVVSDRRHTAKMFVPNSKKYYAFDDVGCFILWQHRAREPWGDKARVIINDAGTGEWIDMREAVYTTGNLTPMGYGFSAYKKGTQPKGVEVVDYAEVKRRVIKIGK